MLRRMTVGGRRNVRIRKRMKITTNEIVLKENSNGINKVMT